MKTILITGSTDGIGLQAALRLARDGHRVIVHGRNQARASEAVKEIKAHAQSAKLETVTGDLASFSEVRAMAGEVAGLAPALDVLINNAGIYAKERRLTTDGHEMTNQVNYLSAFLLSDLLLPLLEKSGHGRIVNVASVAHRSGDLEIGDLDLKNGFDAYGAYAQSKVAMIMFTYELAKKLKDKPVTANVLHPGVIDTKLLREGWGMGGSSVESGADGLVYLAVSPEVENVSGQYFERLTKARSTPLTHDETLQKKLWDLSARWTGLQR